MFNLTKKSQPADPNSKVNLDHKKDFKVEDVPIYTMKKDLENPSALTEESASPVSPARPMRIGGEGLSEREKTSPFLNQETANFSVPASRPASPAIGTTGTYASAPKNTPVPVIKKKTESPDIDETKKINWKRIVLTAMTIFIILVSGAGGYYFWATKQKTPAEPEEISTAKTEPEPAKAEGPEQPVIEAPVPEPAKPSYFVLDTIALDKTKFKTAIDKYFSEMTASPSSSNPKEFIVVDPQNNPIKFKDLASSLKIALSANLLSNLSDTYSLFIYNEDKTPKIGLAIDSKNDAEVKKIMLAEEKALAQELNPIFLLSTYTAEKTFASSSHRGTEIRFKNLISPEKLSIDYAVYKNKLFIGTTKLTLRYMLDSLNTKATNGQ